MYPFRVFISYAHEDKELATALVGFAQKCGLINMWDQAIEPGRPFTEEIKFLISCSHIFVPLLTKASANRPWVHQETGYAIAQDVPVLPIAIENEVPQGMIAEVQALVTNRKLIGLSRHFSNRGLLELVLSHTAPRQPYLSCVQGSRTRSEYIGECATKLRSLLDQRVYSQGMGRVCEQAALSSFSIPNKPRGHRIWKKYEGKVERIMSYREALRKQRAELEWFARRYGCDLVVSPHIKLREKGPLARCTRLELLRRFLQNGHFSDVRVRVLEKVKRSNVLIVGDWFIVKSRSRGQRVGYEESYFSWHAPYVLRELMEFRWTHFGLRELPKSGTVSSRVNHRLYQRCRDSAIAKIRGILKSSNK